MITGGFVDAHSHLRSTTLREQLVIPSNSLEESLLRMSAMTATDPKADSLIACSEMIAAGITGVQAMFHCFADPDGYLEELSQVVAGIEESGIRALVILLISDQAEYLPLGAETEEVLPDWLPRKRNLSHKEFADVFEKAKKMFSSVEIGIGPIGPQWCSDNLLGVISELAQPDTRIHSHLLESKRQRNWVGENPLDRLERHKLLTPKTSLAHGVWCNPSDLSRIAAHGSSLVTCPASNEVLGAGSANIANWIESKVSFGFGFDSSSEEIRPLQTSKAYLGESIAEHALTVGGRECTDLATESDQVSWIDYETGVVESVKIAGRVVFQDGKHYNQPKLDQASSQIREAMDRDLRSRSERKAQIDALLPKYLSTVERCCG